MALRTQHGYQTLPSFSWLCSLQPTCLLLLQLSLRLVSVYVLPLDAYSTYATPNASPTPALGSLSCHCLWTDVLSLDVDDKL